MKFSYIILLSIFFSCTAQEKNIDLIIQNNSKNKIDSLKIFLNSASLNYNNGISTNENIKLQFNYHFEKTISRSGVFVIHYFQDGKGYTSSFGYYDNQSMLKNRYPVFIFDEGVSEINKKTPHLEENKKLIDE